MAEEKRILLIEDELFIREMYTHAFVQEGYIFDVAEDGEVGITMAEKDAYQIILLDIMMPKKNGLDVLRALRKPTSKAINTPILLLTNLGQESVVKEAYAIGANGYLLKSDLLPRQLYEKVQDFLSGALTKEDMLEDFNLG